MTASVTPRRVVQTGFQRDDDGRIHQHHHVAVEMRYIGKKQRKAAAGTGVKGSFVISSFRERHIYRATLQAALIFLH